MTDSVVDQTADADRNTVNNTNCDSTSGGGSEIICNSFVNSHQVVAAGGCNGRARTLSSSLMDESIIMQPLHAKLEINGKTETNYQRKHRRSYSNSKNELSPKRYFNGRFVYF